MKFYIEFTCFLAILAVFIPNAESRNGIQTRIISGTPARSGQFPWQVLLKKDQWDDVLCGGSIISATWVLTAAHCTFGLRSILLAFGTILVENDKAVTMTATQLFIHPKYNNEYLNNDVSLIMLPTPLIFSSTIQPLALVPASDASNNFQGTVATIVGFGYTEDEYLDFSQNLLYAFVKIIDNGQCRRVFGAKVVVSSTLCAKGYKGSNMSLCVGDSGGPLIARDNNGNYMQIGINSFVREDRCTEYFPSGYARLTSFLDYIYDTINNNK